jgi:hypothetical protein
LHKKIAPYKKGRKIRVTTLIGALKYKAAQLNLINDFFAASYYSKFHS